MAATGSVTALVHFISSVQETEQALARAWVGRRIRLISAISTSNKVILPVGAEGKITGLRMDPNAPFTVEFPGMPFKVAPLLDKIAVIP